VIQIDPNGVKMAGTNESSQFELKVGMQIRREPGGAWHLVSDNSSSPLLPPVGVAGPTLVQDDSTAGGPEEEGQPQAGDSDPQMASGEPQGDPGATNAAPEEAAPGGEADPVLLRLMQRRAQENQQ